MAEERSNGARELDALVVGAGPAGLGVGLALRSVPDAVYGVLERGEIGRTFTRWPSRVRFLTPSFTAHAFGATDLNAIHPETSPAHTLKADYPGGAGYARYLQLVAKHYGIPVREHCGVLDVEVRRGGFTVLTSDGPVPTKTLIWAGGEYANPHHPDIDGGDLGVLVTRETAWEPPAGTPVVVIGGYESGLDLACSLVARGHAVTVLDRQEPWAATSSDPSLVLAPRTHQRLHRAKGSGRLTLVGDAEATGIDTDGTGFAVRTADGRRFRSPVPPVLATGFDPHLGPVTGLFDTRPDGWPLLTADDESTTTPGLFLVGPAVRHAHLHLCFVYKFRQRFAHVAKVIGDRLGHDTSGLEAWRKAGMFVDDISCCDVDCAC